MKLNNLQKIIFVIFVLLLFSIPTAKLLTPSLAPILLGGKSFAARSEPVQNLIRSIFALFFAVVYSLSFYLFRASKTGKKITNKINNKIIPGFSSTLLKHQKSPLLIKAVVFILIILIVLFLFVHTKIITFPYQLELREGNTQLTTHAFLNGINPYAIPNNPLYINIYGVLFNLVMLPFARILGNTLQLHRLLNGFFILTQAAIIIKVMRTQKTSWLAAFLASGFIWLGLLFGSTPLARPDALGGCLFLLALFIPWIGKFKDGSLILGAFFGVLAYQTKMYFFLSVIILVSYLFLFISKKKAIFYFLIALALFFLNVYILNSAFETYFVNTFYANSGGPLSFNVPKLVEQLLKFLRDYWGLFIFLFIIAGEYNAKIFNAVLKKIRINFFNFNQPLISINFEFILFCLIITALFVIILLNNGTTQVYYYQLISPFLSILVLSIIDKNKQSKNLFFFIAIATLFTQSVENLISDIKPYEKSNWVKLEKRISKSNQVLNSPSDVSILLDQNKPIAMSGHTQFFFQFPSERFFLFPDPQLMQLEGEKYIHNMAEKVRNKEYDFLETIENDNYEKFLIGERLDRTQADQKFIMSYYHPVELLTIPMPHTNEVWKIGIWEPIR